VLHDKLDPIQQTAVEIAAQVAVQELNATVLAELVGTAQESVVSYQDGAVAATAIVDELDRAVADGDDDDIARLAEELGESTAAMQAALDAADGLTRRLQGEVPPEQAEQLDTATDAVRALADAGARFGSDAEDIDAADVEALRRAVDDVEANLDLVTTIDPDVVSRPFASNAASLLRERVNVNDFFAPAAIALLLQHMMLTFAAMSLVQDRANGLFEIYRVGPIGPVRILTGKFLAYLVIGAAVAASLIAAVTFGIDVPFRGDPWWVAGGVLGLLAASIAAGLLLSMLARTDSQAVQFAMLTLLLGLFFGGFLLDLDAFEYPVKILSWMLPVTYGVRLLRDVMLRGAEADPVDLIALGACTAVYGLGAWFLLRRRLRIR
jgi:ABC-2 type transport system permease protein